MTTEEESSNPSRSNLSRRILIGLILGVASGVFLGELASPLSIVGRAYIGLLQISIVPYMVASLIGGIGQLDYARAGRLAATGGVVLVGSWILAFVVIFIVPIALPPMNAGSFYSDSLVEVANVNFIDLYIPSNPFSSLARTVIPAAAVFSVLTGVALIGSESKGPLLEVLRSMADAMQRLASMIVQLAPFGIFAIATNAAGTLAVEDLGRLQAYIVIFIVASLVLTFWVLPGIASTFTPFGYRDIMRSGRDALVTGFATGNLFIVLPMLVEKCNQLFEEHDLMSEDSRSYVEVLVPASFNFPNIGKLLTLIFVLFAGWYTGSELSWAESPMFAILGIFTLFGGVDLALPFLLDQLRIPSDMYQLYMVTGIVNGWFATLLAVMNLFTFTLVATAASVGALQIHWPRILRFSVGAISVLALALFGTRIALSVLVSHADVQRQTLMSLEIRDPVLTLVHQDLEGLRGRTDIHRPRLAQILERGSLRIGYPSGGLPFVFFNDVGDLVGLDVQLFTDLARELGVSLELVPWSYSTLEKQLARGDFDAAAGGLIITPERMADIGFSEPYMKVTASLVVPDHERNAFPTWRAVAKSKLRIGITGRSRAKRAAAELAEGMINEVESYESFFRGAKDDLDAVMISAEAGSAWTVLHPEYSVAIPKPHHSQLIAIATARGDESFVNFLDDWVRLKQADGTLRRLNDRWILGKVAEEETRRWSVIRDVLHWVE
jgi:Na+/H+-dicarboxylate symporter/ABC-type amino acid transport substrate-binding protein